MKKVLLIIAAVAVTALFSTSCTKKCTCKMWTLGVAAEETSTVELSEDYDSCDQISTVINVGGVKTGLECK